MSEANYPEHDKLRAVKDDSQTVGAFIEWLGENGYHICQQRAPESEVNLDYIAPDPESKRAERMGETFVDVLMRIIENQQVYWPIIERSPDSLLAKYFDINERKIEDEKCAMLDEIRATNAARSAKAEGHE